MSYKIARFGWLPDPPDFRDYRGDEPVVGRAVAQMAKRVAEVRKTVKPAAAKDIPLLAAKPPTAPPASVDLRFDDPPIEDQEDIGSCTAQAVVGLWEHLQIRLHGEHFDGSRLFLYKVTRNYLGWVGDTGAFVRSAIKALRLFGTCPEVYWPYVTGDFDVEPRAFCYAFAQNFKAIAYHRLEDLKGLKRSLAQGLPFAFGFTVYKQAIHAADATGEIPFPGPKDTPTGGHAVVAVGYDDKKKIGAGAGALLIRNSWGTGWGDQGYGWLPYEYVDRGLARDFWVLTEMDYTDIAVPEDVAPASDGG